MEGVGSGGGRGGGGGGGGGGEGGWETGTTVVANPRFTAHRTDSQRLF